MIGTTSGRAGQAPQARSSLAASSPRRPQARWLLLVLLALIAVPVFACVPIAAWSVPQIDGARTVEALEVLQRVRTSAAILLGESHDNAEHHRWQLHTLAILHAQRPDLVVGFEMFPRRTQAVLDRWVAGELSEAEFIELSRWTEVWGFDIGAYMPLFHFARMHRIPMLALNVERDLVRRIGRGGADSVPGDQREGVGQPAPASAEYLRELHTAYLQHGDKSASASPTGPAFRRFVESQLTWDRAMAEAIQEGRRRYPGRQVIGIMGRGHTSPGAVPYQLNALGIVESAVLLPWDVEPGCRAPQTGIADAVFGVAPIAVAAAAARPQLGVALSEVAGSDVRIEQVGAGSVAAAAGLRRGDVLLSVAGRAVRRNADILSALARQAPGTWLPIRIRREGSEIDIVAKFPAL